MGDARVEEAAAGWARGASKALRASRQLYLSSRRCTQSDVLTVVTTIEAAPLRAEALRRAEALGGAGAGPSAGGLAPLALLPSGLARNLREIVYHSPLERDGSAEGGGKAGAQPEQDGPESRALGHGAAPGGGAPLPEGRIEDPLLAEESAFLAKLEVRREARAAQERQAAFRIQRVVRGWLMRRWLARNADKLRVQRKMKRSYQMINKQVKLRQQMLEHAKKQEEGRERASHKVQSAARGFLARKAARKERFVQFVERLNSAATAICAAVRGFMARRARRNLAERRGAERLLRAALCVQSVFRMWLRGKRVVALRITTRRLAAAGRVQRAWRCSAARAALVAERARARAERRGGAIVTIQALVRGVQARGAVALLVAERHELIREAAVLSMQRVARGWLRGRVRVRRIRWQRASLRRSFAAVHVERVVRGFLGRRRAAAAEARAASDIFVQARMGRRKTVEELHALSSCRWRFDINGDSVFTVACRAGNKRLAVKCLKLGLDCDHVNDAGLTGAMLAARNGHDELAEFLVISYKCATGAPGEQSLLHEACLHGRKALAEALVRLPAVDPSGADLAAGGRTPLHCAVAAPRASLELVRVLAASGRAPLDRADAAGATPLHLAAARGLLPQAALLLELGADVRATDAAGRTPWAVAVAAGNEACAHALREGWQHLEGESLDTVSEAESRRFADVPESLIDLVRLRGDKALPKVRAALASGLFPADAAERGSGATLLMVAALAGAADVAAACLDSVQRKDRRGQSAVHYAMCHPASLALFAAQPWCAAMLVKQDAEGVTPLHVAAAQPGTMALPALQALLLRSSGPRIALDQLIDHGGNTPLHYAAFEGRADNVAALLALGASASCANIAGDTALHHMATNPAADVAQQACCELLRGVAAAVNARGDTALHLAAANGCTSLAETLARLAPVTLRTKDPAGRTPLHVAVLPAQPPQLFAALLSVATESGKLAAEVGIELIIFALNAKGDEATIRALVNAVGNGAALPPGCLAPALTAAIAAGQAVAVGLLLDTQPSCLTSLDQARLAVEAGHEAVFLRLASEKLLDTLDALEFATLVTSSSIADRPSLLATLLERANADHDSLVHLTHSAASAGNLECLKLLCARDPELAVAPLAGKRTPLHSAAANGHQACERFLLLDMKASQTRDDEGNTPQMLDKSWT
jgi:ankyrin repeat protein